MLSRVIFFVGFSLILAVAGGFLAIVLFFGDRQGVESRAMRLPPAELLTVMSGFEGQTAGWTIKGRVIETTAGRFAIEFVVRDSNGQPPPEGTRIGVSLEMIEMSMPLVWARVERLRPGEYRASANLSMAGRWGVRIDLPDGPYRFLAKAEI